MNPGASSRRRRKFRTRHQREVTLRGDAIFIRGVARPAKELMRQEADKLSLSLASWALMVLYEKVNWKATLGARQAHRLDPAREIEAGRWPFGTSSRKRARRRRGVGGDAGRKKFPEASSSLLSPAPSPVSPPPDPERAAGTSTIPPGSVDPHGPP